MLVFGPFSAIPGDEEFVVYNLSSPTEYVPRLPGLFVIPEHLRGLNDVDGQFEKAFDLWYYNYILADPIACTSLMNILNSLYNGCNVYICIGNYSDGFINILNESFMKMIQARYDIKYHIVNEINDFQYIRKDGCDFGSVQGITVFDNDRKQFRQFLEEERLLHGGLDF